LKLWKPNIANIIHVKNGGNASWLRGLRGAGKCFQN